MLNLLPDEQKKRVKSEYHWRRRVVVAGALLASVIVATTLLIPTYVSSQLTIGGFQAQKENLERAAQEKERPEFVASLKQTREINDMLQNNHQPLETLPTTVLKRITDSAGTAITLRGFIFQKQKEDSTSKDGEDRITVGVTGVASTRQDLFEFRNNLEELDVFSEIELPLSDLAASRSIDFSLSMTMTHK